MPGIEESTSLAEKWLLHSGIQGKEGEFNAWLDLEKGNYPFAYSEITGYGITALAFLNSRKSNMELVDRAERAAKWVEEEALTAEGAVKTRKYLEGEEDKRFSFESGNVFAFDCGMVLNGLVNLHKATGKKQYLEIGERIAGFLTGKMWKGKEMNAVYNLQKGEAVDNREKWSWQLGSYHAKVAIGLVELAGILGRSDYREKGIQLCENAIAMQQADGRFVTNKSNGSTHLHPHCYSAEGLLFVGKRIGEERFVKAAGKAVKWAVENADSGRGIRACFDGKWNESQRSDVVAQVLRLYCATAERSEENKKKARAIAERLLRFQNREQGAQEGGFFYGTEIDGREKRCLNSWCSMFALQALHWMQAFEREQEADLQFLV